MFALFPCFVVYLWYMKYSYTALYEKNAAFYNARPRLKAALLYANVALTLIFFIAYGLFVAVAIGDEYAAEDLMKILGAPALCLFLVSLLRMAVGRARPYSEQGANIKPMYEKKGDGKGSFPSRHVACAFVIACTIFSYSTGAGICLLPLAALLAYVRFAVGVHYPSDLFGGAILGAICGLLTFIF